MATALAAAKGKGGKGGKAKSGGRKGGGGGIGGQALRLANQQIASAEQPIEQQIAAERQANLAKAQQQIGFSKAAAALLQGIAPRVQDTYTNAANADAGYARGLGDAVQGTVNQNNDANNAFLEKVGVNTGQHAAANVGGTAYGLEGYIPATSLQREGAAFGSAAQMLPGDVISQGDQAATSTLNNDPNLVSLQNELAKLASTKPEVYQKILSQLQDVQFKDIAANQAQQRIGLSRQSLASENAYRNATLGLRAQTLNSENAYRGAELALRKQSVKQAWARIGISQKSLQLRAMQSEAKLHSKGGSGGFSPDELVHIRGKAGEIAQNSFKGVPASGTKSALPPLTYKQAFKQEILAGIPPSVANSSLKEAGYKVPAHWNKLQKTLAGLTFGGGLKSTKAQETILSLAHEYMGTPYVWGGESPKGFDCSGFAQYLYGKAGISIPRTTYTQWQAGRPIGRNQLRPGDLVFFKGSDSRGGLPGHVGIYIGGGKMIDAPHTGSDVRIDNVFNFGGYMGARRYGNG